MRDRKRWMSAAAAIMLTASVLLGCSASGDGAAKEPAAGGNDSGTVSSAGEESLSETVVQEPEYTWRLQTIYNLDTMQGVIATQIAEELERVTNGRLKVEIYPPGGLCQTNDMLTMLSKGAFDMGVSFGNTFSGIIDEGDLEAGLPFAWETADEVYDAFENRGLGDLIQEAYDELGVNWYWIAHEPNYNTLTNFEVTGVDS